MPTNQFYPWAITSGANVYSNAEYANNGALQTGVTAGTGDPQLANNTWRQGTMFSAAWAQVICDTIGQDVLDDGNLTSLIAKLKSMLAATLVTSTPPLYAGQDTSTTPNTITATVTPGMNGPTNGGVYILRNNNTNTGPVQITLNGGQTYPAVKGQGSALAGGELFQGDWVAWTFNGSSYQLLNDKTVTQSLTINVANVTQLQQAVVSTSQMQIASNVFVTILLGAGTFPLTSITQAVAFAHACGLQILVVGAPLKAAVPTYSAIHGLSNAATLGLYQTVFQTFITSVGVNAMEIRGMLGSVQNICFTGDGTASGGHYGLLASNWSTSRPASATCQFVNCAFHGFGLDNVRAESGGYIQANNMLSTFSSAHCYHISHDSALECNVGNILAMKGTNGVALQNQGLFAIDSASGTCDISDNSVAGINCLGMATVNLNPSTGLRIQGNTSYGITSAFMANIALSSNGSTTFSGNGQDINVSNVANVLTFGCALPAGSSPARGSVGNNGAAVY